jgi:hypothetical protein
MSIETITLREAILNSTNINPYSTIYALKIDGKFSSASQAVILELSEEEQEMKTYEIAELKRPGFDYFLELFMIQEMFEAMNAEKPRRSDDEIVNRIIYYGEYDA